MLVGTEKSSREQVKACNPTKEQMDESLGKAKAPELSTQMDGFIEYVRYARSSYRPNSSYLGSSMNSMLKQIASTRAESFYDGSTVNRMPRR